MIREYHYWLYAIEEGRPYIAYLCPAREGEDAARQKGLELLAGIDFELKKLPTRDRAAASAMIRGGTRLPETHSLKQANKRVHGLKRLKRRLRNHAI